MKSRDQAGGHSIVNFGRLCHGRMLGQGDKRTRIEKKKIGGEVYLVNCAKQVSESSWMR